MISLFAMGVEKVMIDEIAREYRHGLGINELYLLNFAYVTNMSFSLLMFLFLLKTFKLVTPEDTKTKKIDEKQLQDMFKSSFTTLLLSVPGLAFLLLFQIPHPILWIFYYIFLIMLLFSSGTLYYFKIKDIV